MTRAPGADSFDCERRAEDVGHDKDQRHSKDEVIVSAHRRCLTAMAAATIQAMPPSAPIAEPTAASWFTKVGSDRNMATAPTAAAIVHKIAATRLQISPITRSPQLHRAAMLFGA